MRMMVLVLVGAMVAGCTETQHATLNTQNSAGYAETEGVTTWNANPKLGVDAEGGLHVLGLASFEGIEEPHMKWVDEGSGKGHVEKKEEGFNNIVDVPEDGGGAVRMTDRYRGGWWDGDQGTSRKDRQRAEVKGVGPHQKNGETFVYATTWRTNADFTDPAKLTTAVFDDPVQKRRRHFCHVFQLKATDGDDGSPMITMSVEEGGKTAAVDYWDVGANQPVVVRTFPWTAGQWNRVAIRVQAAEGSAGAVEVSVNGDPFTGKENITVYRPRSTQYRPKFGLYRAAGPGSGAHDDWVEHKDVVVRKM